MMQHRPPLPSPYALPTTGCTNPVDRMLLIGNGHTLIIAPTRIGKTRSLELLPTQGIGGQASATKSPASGDR